MRIDFYTIPVTERRPRRPLSFPVRPRRFPLRRARSRGETARIDHIRPSCVSCACLSGEQAAQVSQGAAHQLCLSLPWVQVQNPASRGATWENVRCFCNLQRKQQMNLMVTPEENAVRSSQTIPVAIFQKKPAIFQGFSGEMMRS